MSSNESATPREDLEELADRINRSGLRTPVLLLIEMVGPLDVIGSQLAQFSRPFLDQGRWSQYADALAEPGNWDTLRRLLDKAAGR
jgi:hypothetical protein